MCFITTLPPPADFVCTVHAWISSERMRRLRKSFHNLAAAVVTSFSANSGQYLPSWFCWERKRIFVFLFAFCIGVPAALVLLQTGLQVQGKEKRQTDLFQLKHTAHQETQESKHTGFTNRLIFYALCCTTSFSVYHTCHMVNFKWACIVLTCVRWLCGIVIQYVLIVAFCRIVGCFFPVFPADFPVFPADWSIDCHSFVYFHCFLFLCVSCIWELWEN